MRSGLSFLLLACCAAGCVVEQPPGNSTARNNTPANNTSTNSTSINSTSINSTSAAANGSPGVPAPVSDGKLRAYIDAAAQGLAPEMQEALRGVDGDARRLLAVRGYLRGGRDLGTKWAWSRQQIESYEQTPEYAAAVAEVEKVRRKFEELNPGHTLHVNTEVRSLDEQVRNWNEAESVRRAGEEMLAAAEKELSDARYGPAPDDAGRERFERFLRGFVPTAQPTVATPGLSPHGQLRALDFQVRRGRELVAGTSSASARREWDEAGWTAKLREAVGKASTKFTGPLESPYEPWHYNYTP